MTPGTAPTGAATRHVRNSVVFMIEAQLNYVAGALAHMRENGATRLEVTQQAQDADNARIQARLARTVWNTGGCSSWYLDRTGRNTTIWHDFTFRFWGRMRRFDPEAYDVGRTTRRAPAPAVAVAPA